MALLPPSQPNRTYKIPCRGVGVLPALELSHNAINFSATALGDSATTSVRVSNPRQGRLSSAVIRGALLPQGPKMYEFSVPPGCPFTVSPQVGEVPLGEVSTLYSCVSIKNVSYLLGYVLTKIISII